MYGAVDEKTEGFSLSDHMGVDAVEAAKLPSLLARGEGEGNGTAGQVGDRRDEAVDARGVLSVLIGALGQYIDHLCGHQLGPKPSSNNTVIFFIVSLTSRLLPPNRNTDAQFRSFLI